MNLYSEKVNATTSGSVAVAKVQDGPKTAPKKRTAVKKDPVAKRQKKTPKIDVPESVNDSAIF